MRQNLLFLFLFVFSVCKGQTYFNQEGNAIFYYNQTKNAIFNFKGEPLYFLSLSNSRISIFNYSGQHIGWIVDGCIINHKGYVYATVKDYAQGIYYQNEPYKPYEKTIPYKSNGNDSEPKYPVFQKKFQDFLGNEDAYSTNYAMYEKYYKPDYTPYTSLKPYELPTDAIYNSLKALNEQHQRMLANGYILDPSSGNYVTRESYIAKLQAISDNYNQTLQESYKNGYFSTNNLKNGWYVCLVGTSSNQNIFYARVKIKNKKFVKLKVVGNRTGTGNYYTKQNVELGTGFVSVNLKRKKTFWDVIDISSDNENYVLNGYLFPNVYFESVKKLKKEIKGFR